MRIIVMLLGTFAASVALAGEPTVAFQYVDDSGVVSFTDEERRIPARYKERSQEIILGELSDYAKFTYVITVPVPADQERP